MICGMNNTIKAIRDSKTKTQAARSLGISRNTLEYRIHQLEKKGYKIFKESKWIVVEP